MSETDKKILIDRKVINKLNNDITESDIKIPQSRKVFSFKKETSASLQNTKQNTQNIHINNNDLKYIIDNIDSFSVNQLKDSIKKIAILLSKLI